MSSAWTVPAGLRLLLDDIIRAMLDDAGATTPLDERQICRQVADLLDTWLDERAQLELIASQRRHSRQTREKSTEKRDDQQREHTSADTKGIG